MFRNCRLAAYPIGKPFGTDARGLGAEIEVDPLPKLGLA